MKIPMAAAALLAAAACGAAERSPAAPSSTSAAAPAIVAFGDSLTAGPGLTADETYPAVLERKLASAGYAYHVVNAGVSGETTSDGVRRFNRALLPEAKVLILAMGANDGLRGVAIETVRRNLSIMIEEAQARGMRVLLCGMETPPTHGLQYSVDFHFLFAQLASRYNVPLVPFVMADVLGRPELTLDDGIHPNAQGAALIAQAIYPYVVPLLSAGVFTY